LTGDRLFGVDLDNVLSHTDEAIRALIAERHNIILQQSDIVHFDYSLCGISGEQFRDVLSCFHETCDAVDPIAEAIDGLRTIAEGWRIEIVTSRPEMTRSLTESWLAAHSIPHDKLMFVSDKVAIARSFRAFIDDHRETVYGLVREGITGFLFDRPWNQAVAGEPDGVIRVETWAEVARHLALL
jgi:uncharacterized HAD superfamily protein